MTMELEGTLLLERARTRRWVPIIAVIIPVAAIVLLAAWFVRVYIAPATVLIPNPPMLTAEAPEPAAMSVRAQNAKPPPVQMTEPATSAPQPLPPAEPTASTLPMFATLALVPPAIGNAAPAYADPVHDDPPAAIMVEETDAIEPGEPIAGAVPLPRAKPHARMALLARAIPLPRPRPTETAPPVSDDLPVIDRHSSQ